MTFSTTYLKQLVENAVSAAAGTALLVASADSAGILEWHWQVLASLSGAAAALSVLKSLASKPFGDTNSASAISPAPAASPAIVFQVPAPAAPVDVPAAQVPDAVPAPVAGS